ncbi:hypothetical protein [Halosimplex halophilum]|uniref:hypothetical protein n=1 Tax=Halosimplex halophilum TaxID=2559572 RepID=UPI00107FCCC1|nr:hypothetical protein [Halosimplex halophilum]
MDPDRRDLLKVLGVLGVGGAGSAVLLSGDDGDQPSDSPSTASDVGTPTTGGEPQSGGREDYAAAVERVGSDLTEPPSLPEPTRFDYDPVDVSFEDRWLGRFAASPANGGDGDRMRATPGTGSPDEVLTTFRRWLGLPDERWGEATLAGETVELRGGAIGGVIAVLGTVDGRGLVVGARAVDEATLDGVVSSWELPES